jgi:acetoin:2,6-dichlorophenolindophenol oxidoreductase subunit alpha
MDEAYLRRIFLSSNCMAAFARFHGYPVRSTEVIELAEDDRQKLLRAYRDMFLVRRVEERIIEQYAEQNAAFAKKEAPKRAIKCPTHLSIGQESAAVGVAMALTKDDVAFSTHRCHAHYLAKGGSVPAMMAELMGKETGCSAGKGGSMHLFDESVGMLGASAIVGGSIPLAAGAALSFSLQKKPHVAVAFFGDGAVEQGVFHEAMNVAALRKLPLLLVCENNAYATLSHVSSRQAAPIAERAASYGGVAGVRVSGDDVLAVERAATEAVRRARAGEGPTLLEIDVYRWMSHVGTVFDTGKMRRTAEELDEARRRDPVMLARKRLVEAGVSLEDLEREVLQVIEDGIRFADESKEPARTAMFEHVGAGLQA